MSRDKQVEEMVMVLTESQHAFDRAWKECLHNNAPMPDRENVFYAKYLVEKEGYRKSTEVAEEIFAEIEEMLNLQAKIVCETRDKYSETNEPLLSFIAMLDGRIYSLRVVEEHIAELKKKYKESEKDNGN